MSDTCKHRSQDRGYCYFCGVQVQDYGNQPLGYLRNEPAKQLILFAHDLVDQYYWDKKSKMTDIESDNVLRAISLLKKLYSDL